MCLWHWPPSTQFQWTTSHFIQTSFALYSLHTHTNLRGLWLSASAALVASCLINLCEHVKLKLPTVSQLNNYRNTGWSFVLLHGFVENTEMKQLLGVTELTFVSSFMSQWHNELIQLAHLNMNAAMAPGENCSVVLNCLRFHISVQMWMTKQNNVSWADEAYGGRATALIAPCDSATSLQPISWQLARKLTLWRRRQRTAAPGELSSAAREETFSKNTYSYI